MEKKIMVGFVLLFVLLLLIAGVGEVIAVTEATEAENGGAIIEIYHPINGETFCGSGSNGDIIVNTGVTGYEGAVITAVTVNGVNATKTEYEGFIYWTCWVSLYPGENNITVRVVDIFGRVTVKSITMNYKQTWLEEEGILLGIESHYDGQIVDKEKITVSGYVLSYPLDIECTYIDSVTVNGIDAGIDEWWSTEILLQPGNNTITVIATDNLGNSAKQVITVIYDDSMAPLIIIDGPIDGETVYSNMIMVHGAARGRDGVCLDFVTVNGVNATGNSLWSAEVFLVPGKNEITIIATDECGLTTTKTITVIYKPVTINVSINIAGNEIVCNCTCRP
jgi:hypothetical protein